MRAYIRSFLAQAQTTLQYRLNAVLAFGFVLFPAVSSYFLWSAVLPEQRFGEYDFAGMFTYYFLASFFAANTPSGSWPVGKWIELRRLAKYLVRPVDLYGFALARALGGHSVTWLVSLLGTMLLAVAFRSSLVLPGDPRLWGVALVYWLGGVVIGFAYGFIVASVAFWVQEFGPFSGAFGILALILSGAVVPLDLLPFGEFLAWLPFRYSVFLPARVLLGKADMSTFGIDVAVLCVWALVLISLAHLVWNRGVRHYQVHVG